jgi:hypothetical protein
MKKDLFNLGDLKVGDQGWVTKYCLNRLSELQNIENVFRHLLLGGGIGGDIEWGIHRWDENTASDFEVGPFEGYRFYVGELEHGIDGEGDIDEFSTDDELKHALASIAKHYIDENPNQEFAIKELARELAIPLS